MPSTTFARNVFFSSTMFANYKGYVQRLMSTTDWNDPKNIIRTSISASALDTALPARLRTRTTTVPYTTLIKTGTGTGWSPSQSSVDVTVRDDAVYDWLLGKYNNDWLGGPFHAYRMRRDPKPSSRRDHKDSPYEVAVFLGGPGKFWYSDRVVISITPYTGTVGFTGSKVSAIPQDLSPIFARADALVQGARNSSDPGKAQHNFGTSLVELRELPRILKNAGDNIIAKGSSRFLEYQFAVLPMIRDLRALYHLGRSLHKQMAFLKKNEGVVVKRRRLLFELEGVPTTVRTFSSSGEPTYGNAKVKPGTYPILDQWRVKAWYCSKIRFDLNYDLPDWDWNLEAVAILTGLRPNFFHLWSLTPWTWLIDWFSNIGDLVEKTFDSSVTTNHILSEWIMVTAEATSYVEVPCSYRKKASEPPISAGIASCKVNHIAKARQVPSKVTTPYFALDTILTRTQQAILAALLGSRIRWDLFSRL